MFEGWLTELEKLDEDEDRFETLSAFMKKERKKIAKCVQRAKEREKDREQSKENDKEKEEKRRKNPVNYGQGGSKRNFSPND